MVGYRAGVIGERSQIIRLEVEAFQDGKNGKDVDEYSLVACPVAVDPILVS